MVCLGKKFEVIKKGYSCKKLQPFCVFVGIIDKDIIAISCKTTNPPQREKLKSIFIISAAINYKKYFNLFSLLFINKKMPAVYNYAQAKAVNTSLYLHPNTNKSENILIKQSLKVTEPFIIQVNKLLLLL